MPTKTKASPATDEQLKNMEAIAHEWRLKVMQWEITAFGLFVGLRKLIRKSHEVIREEMRSPLLTQEQRDRVESMIRAHRQLVQFAKGLQSAGIDDSELFVQSVVEHRKELENYGIKGNLQEVIPGVVTLVFEGQKAIFQPPQNQ